MSESSPVCQEVNEKEEWKERSQKGTRLDHVKPFRPWEGLKSFIKHVSGKLF